MLSLNLVHTLINTPISIATNNAQANASSNLINIKNKHSKRCAFDQNSNNLAELYQKFETAVVECKKKYEPKQLLSNNDKSTSQKTSFSASLSEIGQLCERLSCLQLMSQQQPKQPQPHRRRHQKHYAKHEQALSNLNKQSEVINLKLNQNSRHKRFINHFINRLNEHHNQVTLQTIQPLTLSSNLGRSLNWPDFELSEGNAHSLSSFQKPSHTLVQHKQAQLTKNNQAQGNSVNSIDYKTEAPNNKVDKNNLRITEIDAAHDHFIHIEACRVVNQVKQMHFTATHEAKTMFLLKRFIDSIVDVPTSDDFHKTADTKPAAYLDQATRRGWKRILRRNELQMFYRKINAATDLINQQYQHTSLEKRQLIFHAVFQTMFCKLNKQLQTLRLKTTSLSDLKLCVSSGACPPLNKVN